MSIAPRLIESSVQMEYPRSKESNQKDDAENVTFVAIIYTQVGNRLLGKWRDFERQPCGRQGFLTSRPSDRSSNSGCAFLRLIFAYTCLHLTDSGEMR